MIFLFIYHVETYLQLNICHVEKLLHMTICHMENFLHMTNFFSTTTGCDGCDKYQVCTVNVPLLQFGNTFIIITQNNWMFILRNYHCNDLMPTHIGVWLSWLRTWFMIGPLTGTWRGGTETRSVKGGQIHFVFLTNAIFIWKNTPKDGERNTICDSNKYHFLLEKRLF